MPSTLISSLTCVGTSALGIVEHRGIFRALSAPLHPMCFRLLFLLLALVFAFAPAFAEDFETDVTPKFTYSEVYNDTIVKDPEFDDYEVIPRTSLKITAICSMKGVNLSAIDEDTTVSIDFEGLMEEWTLGDDPTYTKGKTSATIPLFGMNPSTGEDMEVGAVSVVWNSKTVTISFTAKDDPDSFQVMAQDRAFEGEENSEYTDSATVTVGFAGRELSGRTAYIKGTIGYVEYESGDIYETLIRVNLRGEIDSEGPDLKMLKPLEGAEIRERSYTISGTVFDNYGVARVSVKLNGGEEIPAVLDMVGNWSVPLEFTPGTNTIVALATDRDGNVTTLKSRSINFAPSSDLTVKAEGTAGGQVTSSFFNAIFYSPGVPSPQRITLLQDGTTLSVTAIPAPGAIFDRWISNYPLENETSPKLQFTMQPAMILTARFVPNVFQPVRGKYSGLLGSSSPEGRGFMAVQLAGDGSFSGSIKLGRSTVRLKGKFGADGTFVGVVKAGKQLFDLSLRLAVSDGNSKQVTGTFQPHAGPDTPTTVAFTSSVTADLGVYKKKVREVSAELAGGYNVLLAPASTNVDANFPVGIGFGRVTLSKFGSAKFVGKLGDGTPVAASAPVSEDGFWPVYAFLYGKKGAVTGRVKFDRTHLTSDLSGDLQWFRPTSWKGVHAEGFAGQVQLTGAKYARPAAGQRLFLNPEGNGLLSFDAPSGGAALAALALDSNVILSSTNQLMAADATLEVAAKFNVTTGLFTGSFQDLTQNKRVSFSGAVVIGGSADAPKGNVAGGFFVRGNRTGAVQLTEPVLNESTEP